MLPHFAMFAAMSCSN